jgi:hypothetical protein
MSVKHGVCPSLPQLDALMCRVHQPKIGYS